MYSQNRRKEERKEEEISIDLKEGAWKMPIPLRPSFAASWFQSLWRRGAADLSGAILVERERERELAKESREWSRLSPFTSRALASSPPSNNVEHSVSDVSWLPVVGSSRSSSLFFFSLSAHLFPSSLFSFYQFLFSFSRSITIHSSFSIHRDGTALLIDLHFAMAYT